MSNKKPCEVGTELIGISLRDSGFEVKKIKGKNNLIISDGIDTINAMITAYTGENNNSACGVGTADWINFTIKDSNAANEDRCAVFAPDNMEYDMPEILRIVNQAFRDKRSSKHANKNTRVDISKIVDPDENNNMKGPESMPIKKPIPMAVKELDQYVIIQDENNIIRCIGVYNDFVTAIGNAYLYTEELQNSINTPITCSTISRTEGDTGWCFAYEYTLDKEKYIGNICVLQVENE